MEAKWKVEMKVDGLCIKATMNSDQTRSFPCEINGPEVHSSWTIGHGSLAIIQTTEHLDFFFGDDPI